ncbi:hypothetical protein DIPPA_03496 [Diplonema papillatum]|nr:hypothetical protein DIPPA_03496 [Diplonema papillatum]
MAGNYSREPSALTFNSSLGYTSSTSLSCPAASAPVASTADEKAHKMKKLEQILAQYEVSIADANELAALEGYEIVFICDDSSSMNRIAEVACCFDDDGIDVYFLNRNPVFNVSSCSDPRLIAAFQARPTGRTPLTQTIKKVIQDKKHTEKPLLLLIATDGEPDHGPGEFKLVIEQAIKKKIPICKFQILACTAEDDQIAWINDFDDAFYEVDATDDFYSERAEILRTGRLQKFTRGDWVMKALLGPILRMFDEWDEAPAVKALPPSFAYRAPPQQPSFSTRQTADPECCLIM